MRPPMKIGTALPATLARSGRMGSSRPGASLQEIVGAIDAGEASRVRSAGNHRRFILGGAGRGNSSFGAVR